jgi:predicted membrane GTPase involved in stress response
VTPATVRLRKVILDASERERTRGKRAKAKLAAE